MGKRSNFERNPRDYYPTPYDAILPLLPFLPENTRFVEPCAGDGRLARHLEKHGHICSWKSDLLPQADDIVMSNVLNLDFSNHDMIITNTPWDREILHKMIKHFRKYAPAWLLLDADYMFTQQYAPYGLYVSKIVAVGRVKWIEGTDNTGMDNAAWYCFERHPVTHTEFYLRPKNIRHRCTATKDLF